MERIQAPENKVEMRILCNKVRELININDYMSCVELIRNAMSINPHAPEPHNLFGILLEKNEDHLLAMRHFRAAWALDPTYIPARQNLIHYGTFYSNCKCAYDESDCPKENIVSNKIKFDAHGIGQITGGNDDN